MVKNRLSKEEFAFSKRLQGICNPEKMKFGRAIDGWYIWINPENAVLLTGKETSKEIRAMIAAKMPKPKKSRLKQLFDNARGWFA